jgi:hypothetical protein
MKYAEQRLLKALTKAEVEFLGQSSIDDIVKVMEDYASEMKVKNLSSNAMLGDSLPSTKCDDCRGDIDNKGECFCNR